MHKKVHSRNLSDHVSLIIIHWLLVTAVPLILYLSLGLMYHRLHLQLNEIRKMNSNLIVIGKTTVDNDKEDFDNDADDDDGDNAEESEGDDFEQETG